jgi:host factor-I protein
MNMNNKSPNTEPATLARRELQEPFLAAVYRQRVPVDVYLINGLRRQGMLVSFNQETITIRDMDEHMLQVIYKHAISSVLPVENIDFKFEEE